MDKKIAVTTREIFLIIDIIVDLIGLSKRVHTNISFLDQKSYFFNV
jgi:hypothetical protein